jgi:hypothetical protein
MSLFIYLQSWSEYLVLALLIWQISPFSAKT